MVCSLLDALLLEAEALLQIPIHLYGISSNDASNVQRLYRHVLFVLRTKHAPSLSNLVRLVHRRPVSRSKLSAALRRPVKGAIKPDLRPVLSQVVWLAGSPP